MKTIRYLFSIHLMILISQLMIFGQIKYYGTNNSGYNASAIGYYSEATGSFCFSAGYSSEANGGCSFSGGNHSVAGAYSVALGNYCNASGDVSVALGDVASATGHRSYSMGRGTYANVFMSTALGTYNVSMSGSSSSWVETNPLFVIGNGESSSARSNALTILKNGNVGIGETNPLYGQIQVKPSIADEHHGITIYAGGSTARSYVKSDGEGDYNWHLTRGGVDGKGILITKNGYVGIGITSVPSGYHLAVDGAIIAEEIQVKMSEYWPDYVFNKDYKLMPLRDLEDFVQSHNHLPGVPSAEEINENGINLGEMDAILLKKIEELTLHLIALKKENTQLMIKQQELIEQIIK